MPKRTREKDEIRLWRINKAFYSEQERVIEQNNELNAEIAALRARYGIHPQGGFPENMLDLIKDVNAIGKKFSINARMNESLWCAVWGIGCPGELGMPSLFWHAEIGEGILIGPETDMSNALVVDVIKAFQKILIKKDAPPQPQKKGRRLDWTPVWEWSMRHPQVTRKDLARMLSRSYVDVKRKLKEIDNSN